MQRFDLTGRTALVTGSSRGIGKALAKALLEGGARVIVHGRERERVETTAAALNRLTGGLTLAAAFDVTNASEV
jgi:gluconate 5-dehydrogenase